MKNLLIVARYNEDISWTDNLDTDILIYNKGESLPEKYNSIEIENIGRDSETFLRSISENYSLIKENYDHVSFYQGDPFDHYPSALEILPLNNNDINYKFPKPLYGGNGIWFYKNQNGFSFDLNTNILESISVSHDLYQKMFEKILNDLDLPYYGFHLETAGCQYIVPKKYIINKSHQWWINAHNIYIDHEKVIFKNIDYPGMGYLFEKVWFTLWNYN